jgi:hypothetical protein
MIWLDIRPSLSLSCRHVLHATAGSAFWADLSILAWALTQTLREDFSAIRRDPNPLRPWPTEVTWGMLSLIFGTGRFGGVLRRAPWETVPGAVHSISN